MIEQGLNSKDWGVLLSKIKRGNLEQLTFLVLAVQEEILKRKGVQ